MISRHLPKQTFQYPTEITRGEGDKGYKDVVRFEQPGDAFQKACQDRLGERLTLMPSGYSKAPENHAEYDQSLNEFLDGAIESSLAVVTSSTTGSVEQMATAQALKDSARLLHVTAERYMNKYTPAVSDFQPEFQEQAAAIPKFVLPDKETYLEAAVKASNAVTVLGGRGAAVGDFKEAVESGKPTVVAVDLDAPAFAWDDYNDTKVPSNASQYIADQISSQPEIEDPASFPEAIEPTWLEANHQALAEKVKVIRFHGKAPGSAFQAGQQALSFLKSALRDEGTIA